MRRFRLWRPVWGLKRRQSGGPHSVSCQAPTSAEIQAANEIYGAVDEFLQTLTVHDHDRHVCALHQLVGWAACSGMAPIERTAMPLLHYMAL